VRCLQHDKNESKIEEVECVRSFLDDKFESKIVEVECVRSFQDDKLYAIQNPFNLFNLRAKKNFVPLCLCGKKKTLRLYGNKLMAIHFRLNMQMHRTWRNVWNI
jgi:hypothetical protein